MERGVTLREQAPGCVWPVLAGLTIIAFTILASFPLTFVVLFLGDVVDGSYWIVLGAFAACWLGSIFGGSLIASRAVARSFLAHATDRDRRIISLAGSASITGLLTIALLAWAKWVLR